MTRNAARLIIAAVALLTLAACVTESGAIRGAGDEGWQPPSKGPRHAPVTIYEFSDFECPFCSRVSPQLGALRDEFGDKVRLVFGQYPLPMHPNARLAAEAALAAHDQGKFWEMHDVLFLNQGNITRETVGSFAAQLGLDGDRFGAALDKGIFKAQVDADIAAAKAMGVKGTPAFVINGVLLFGAQPYREFKAAVEDALKRADALMKAGVPLENLDAEFTKQATQNLGKPAASPDGKAAAPSRKPAPTAAPSDLAQKDEPVPAVPPVAEQYGLGNVRGAPEGHPQVPDRRDIPLAGSPTLGPESAPVTLVVFSDFQCPYCALMSAVLHDAQAAYRDKVRLVYKNFPLDFHDMGRPAAEAALSAGDQGKFWEMHDAIYAVKGGKALTHEALMKAARDAGVDTARVQADIRAETHKAQIDRDLALGAELDVSGTPTLYVNGRKLAGVPKPENLKALIDEELKRLK